MVNIRRWATLILATLTLSACTQQEAVDQPLTQRFAWFGYLNGDEIRESCYEGAPWRARLVYNGRYQEQVRIYNLAADGAGGAFMTVRAQGPVTLASLGVDLDDILAPWRWRRAETTLSPEQTVQFFSSLEDSGLYQPAPPGLQLASPGFYWVAIVCQEGAVQFNAWQYDSARFAELSFPAFLFAHDQTALAVNQPRLVDPAELIDLQYNERAQGPRGPTFWVRVGDNGLEGF